MKLTPSYIELQRKHAKRAYKSKLSHTGSIHSISSTELTFENSGIPSESKKPLLAGDSFEDDERSGMSRDVNNEPS